MHRDRASNYDMLMRTQCTICLSSDHGERCPQRRHRRCHSPVSISLSPTRRLHFPNVSLPSVQRRGSDGAVIPSSALLVSSPPLFPSVSSALRLSEAPEASSFPPSSHFSLFFHFLCLDPDSSHEK